MSEKKVYIVGYYDYEGFTITKIFLDNEKAEEFIKKENEFYAKQNITPYYIIEEWDAE